MKLKQYEEHIRTTGRIVAQIREHNENYVSYLLMGLFD